MLCVFEWNKASFWTTARCRWSESRWETVVRMFGREKRTEKYINRTNLFNVVIQKHNFNEIITSVITVYINCFRIFWKQTRCNRFLLLHAPKSPSSSSSSSSSSVPFSCRCRYRCRCCHNLQFTMRSHTSMCDDWICIWSSALMGTNTFERKEKHSWFDWFLSISNTSSPCKQSNFK